MPNQDQISPNQKDRDLARAIGESLPDVDKLSELNDPLLVALLSYKNSRKETAPAIQSDQIWASIKSDIEAQPQKQATIRTLFPAFKRLAVAASIVILALASFWIYQVNRGDILIGESFATKQVIELSDGTVVTLRPHSKLYEVSLSDDNHSFRLTGEGYFEVQSNSQRIFSVTTSQSKVEVLGTKFVFSDWGNSSKVFLEEGRVRFTSTSTQKSIELSEGEASAVSSSHPIPEIQTTDAAEYKDWLANELIFRNKPARAVFNELEQHFNISIVAETPPDEEDLSGTIQLDDLQSVLQNLELVLNGNFSQTGERSYTFRGND